jgi:DNA-binding MarR family transcriptional regulator
MMTMTADPRLILREEELDSGLEMLLLAEAAVWAAADTALAGEARGLGRSHWRAALLLRRRPALGVQELAKMTGLTKQAASRTLADLEKLGLAAKSDGELDARRKIVVLTAEGRAFEARVSERVRALVAKAWREGGLDGVPAAKRILNALAGSRMNLGLPRRDTL